MNLLQSVILSIIEGITEFLPISSTGHLIIGEYVLGVDNSEFTKLFTVNIQFGAIFSVIVLYWKKFFQTFDFYFRLFAAFIPAAILGFLAGDFVDKMLENVTVVAWTTLLGGLVLIFVDKWFK